MPMSCCSSTDQFPCFSAASFADHNTVRSGTKSCADQIVCGNGRRSTLYFGTSHSIDNISGIRRGVAVPAIQHNLIGIFHNEKTNCSRLKVCEHFLKDSLSDKGLS